MLKTHAYRDVRLLVRVRAAPSPRSRRHRRRAHKLMCTHSLPLMFMCMHQLFFFPEDLMRRVPRMVRVCAEDVAFTAGHSVTHLAEWTCFLGLLENLKD